MNGEEEKEDREQLVLSSCIYSGCEWFSNSLIQVQKSFIPNERGM